MSDHLDAVHPTSGGSEGGRGGKSNDAIPVLEERLPEIAWSAWRARFTPLGLVL